MDSYDWAILSVAGTCILSTAFCIGWWVRSDRQREQEKAILEADLEEGEIREEHSRYLGGITI
jgi:hypothetical protein